MEKLILHGISRVSRVRRVTLYQIRIGKLVGSSPFNPTNPATTREISGSISRELVGLDNLNNSGGIKNDKY